MAIYTRINLTVEQFGSHSPFVDLHSPLQANNQTSLASLFPLPGPANNFVPYQTREIRPDPSSSSRYYYNDEDDADRSSVFSQGSTVTARPTSKSFHRAPASSVYSRSSMNRDPHFSSAPISRFPPRQITYPRTAVPAAAAAAAAATSTSRKGYWVRRKGQAAGNKGSGEKWSGPQGFIEIEDDDSDDEALSVGPEDSISQFSGSTGRRWDAMGRREGERGRTRRREGSVVSYLPSREEVRASRGMGWAPVGTGGRRR